MPGNGNVFVVDVAVEFVALSQMLLVNFVVYVHANINWILYNFFYDVIKQLENLNQNKAIGIGSDELPSRVLKVKETAKQIAPIITQIFQQSYNTGKLSNNWLQALVTPIHKKSHKSDPANYRPISLTCILCKVMEHIILSNMWKHLHKHNIILHFQHGFQSGLSCESQLIETVHDWMTAMDNKTQIDAILLDFAKAFDKEPHLRLL